MRVQPPAKCHNVFKFFHVSAATKSLINTTILLDSANAIFTMSSFFVRAPCDPPATPPIIFGSFCPNLLASTLHCLGPLVCCLSSVAQAYLRLSFTTVHQHDLSCMTSITHRQPPRRTLHLHVKSQEYITRIICQSLINHIVTTTCPYLC